jgi:hypothetical protein
VERLSDFDGAKADAPARRVVTIAIFIIVDDNILYYFPPDRKNIIS